MGPLDDIRVIELGQLIAGPYCGQVLADFGAEVVKVEPPQKGDAMRQWGREDEKGRGLWWPVIARNKQSVTIDLRQPDGQELLRRMVREADILIENFRPGTMERWNLGWGDLKKINPRLIMVRVTGFGQTGPYSDRAGFASVCEAMGGLRYICGYPDRPPVRVGISLGDTLAGTNAAMGALVALHHRERTGEGQVVDSSIYESVLGVMESLIPEYAKAGHIRERSGSVLPGIAPSNAYPTSDGLDIVIGANQDTVFARLCEAMGDPALANDARFRSHRDRGAHQEELDALISEWTARHSSSQLVEILADAGVPAGLVYRAPEMLQDPHFKARESIVEVEDPEEGDSIPMQNVFPKLSGSPGAIRHIGPQLSKDTESVLSRWLQMEQREIDDLKRDGVV